MTAYATPLEVFQYMNWVQEYPPFVGGTIPNTEIVDNSGALTTSSVIYLDNNKLIENTESLTYGITTSSDVALTRTTDYTINYDTGAVTLTGTGSIKISTSYVYATEYKYNDQITNTYMADLIDRAEKEINKKTKQIFGTSTLVIHEEQPGRGPFDYLYRTRKLPVYVVKTQLSAAALSTASSFTVDSTAGFKKNDIITIKDEQLTIGTVTDATTLEVNRAQYGTTTATYAIDDYLVNMAVDISNSYAGATPTFNNMGYKDSFDADSDTGAIQLLHVNSEDKDDLVTDVFPPTSIFNRMRISYKHGKPTIPTDITDLCIQMVSYKLMASAIAKSLPDGIDGFSPTAQSQIKADIKEKLNSYKLLLADGY